MNLLWARFKRWMASASSVGLLFLMPLAALAIGALGTLQGPSEIHPGEVVFVIPEGWMVIVVIVTFCLAAVIAIIETIEKYQRLTYERTLAIKYWERLRGMKEERAKAASALSMYHDELGDLTEMRKESAPIDEILDELDAIGLYVSGQQMSPEIAHNFFYRSRILIGTDRLAGRFEDRKSYQLTNSLAHEGREPDKAFWNSLYKWFSPELKALIST
jgi:hypothetical protein